MKVLPAEPASGAQGNLSPDELRAAQEETLRTPLRPYGLFAKAFFIVLNTLYGRGRTLRKFKVFEVTARVPYQTWESAGYAAIGDPSVPTPAAPEVLARIMEARRQQDNEQWHALILQDLLEQEGQHQGVILYRLVPRVIAFVYYRIVMLVFAVRPAWSYRLNADFEDHAEHEYMQFVAENPEFERRPFVSRFADSYRPLPTLADLFRQIAYDERTHKLESDLRAHQARSG